MRYSQTLRIIGPDKYPVKSDWNTVYVSFLYHY